MKLPEWLKIYLKGLAMGSADAIPGVSGGTIALITGIYTRLIDALTTITPSKILELSKEILKGNLSALKSSLMEMDVPFLIVLVAGIFSALLAVLNFVHVFLTSHPVPTYGFFFGLIGLSAVVLYEEIDVTTLYRKLAALTGFILAFIASGLGAGSLGHAYPVLFLSGMIAVSAMVLPGISGSLFLVMLGQYDFISGALSDFTTAALEFLETGSLEEIIAASPPIIVFVSGAFVGLFTIIHIVEKALKNYREATMVFLVSMILGALRAPLVQVEESLVERGVSWAQVAPEFALSAVFGGLLIFVIHRKTGEI